MGLDNKYFSFCKEIGIMKENTSHQGALDCIKKAVRNTKAADPKFVEAVERLTLSSPEVSVRSCVLYHYDIDVDYVIGGKIKNTRINDFGHSGVHDSLHITEYSGNGEYTVLKDVSSVPYPIFNNKNLFTFDSMKNALSDLVSKALPSSTTSFQSKNWSVSAYIVPTLVIILNYNKKEYQMYYNLQNGHYHWSWADNPVLLKKGSQAKGIVTLVKVVSIVLSVIAIITGFSTGFAAAAVPIIILIAQILIFKKTNKSKWQYQNIYKNKPETKLMSLMTSAIIMVVMGVVALVLAGVI